MILNMIGGSTGGNGEINLNKGVAAIVVYYPRGCKCNCKENSTLETLYDKFDSNAGDQSGFWVFSVPREGSYTITITEQDGTENTKSTYATKHRLSVIRVNRKKYIYQAGMSIDDWKKVTTSGELSGGTLVINNNYQRLTAIQFHPDNGTDIRGFCTREKVSIKGFNTLHYRATNSLANYNANAVIAFSTSPTSNSASFVTLNGNVQSQQIVPNQLIIERTMSVSDYPEDEYYLVFTIKNNADTYLIDAWLD